LTLLDAARFARFGLELVTLVLCFRVIRTASTEGDKAAAWAIIGLVVASVIRNLAEN